MSTLIPITHAQGLPPALSPYVQKTIERSEQGITAAWNTENTIRFSLDVMGSWQRAATGLITRFIDTNQRIILERQNLLSDSACLRADQILLELEMERVRGEVNKAVASQSIVAFFTLEKVLEFLNVRYAALVQGATDPTVADEAWYTPWPFEPKKPQTWCCKAQEIQDTCMQATEAQCLDNGGTPFASLQQCTNFGCMEPLVNDTEPPQCPFDSDYLPPSANGYGCDADVLAQVLTNMPMNTFTHAAAEEMRALLIMQQARDQSRIAAGIVQGQEPHQRVHMTRTGCVMGGQCEADPTVRCTTAGECPGESRCLDARSIGQCENRQDKVCYTDDDCGNGALCQRLSQAMQTELRGPFSLERNEQGLLEAFRAQRIQEGGDRPHAEGFLGKNNTGILELLAGYGRDVFFQFNAAQGGLEASTFAVGADPMVQAGTSFDSLNKSVATLGKLASDKAGLRSFVRDFAWFLRRSCLDRPCNNRLDRILKIVFTDECFPYTSGKYKDATPADPGWKKCMDAAGISPLEP